MRTLLQDLRFAGRLFSGSAGFTLVAVLTLALGIASAATVFTWIDSLLVHPFPGTRSSGDLSLIEMRVAAAPNGGGLVSWPDYTDFRDHLKLVSGVAIHRQTAFALGEGDDARLVWGELVSANYFDVLGVNPALGRMFAASPGADTPGAYPVAVIGDRLWRGYFHADPGIVGKTVRVNRRMLTVVGVAPPEFRGTTPAMVLDLWVPASMGVELGLLRSDTLTDRGERDFNSIVARLKPGVTREQAGAEVKTLAANMTVAYPKTNRGVSAVLAAPWHAQNGTGELLLAPLETLMGVALLLLLIVCANVGNLLLARSVARHREFGIRVAMGASAWRIARQLLTESLLLAAAAAGLSLVMLLWMAPALIGLVPSVGLPIASEFQLNWRIVAFTIAACLGAGLLSGFAPALISFTTDLNRVLKESVQRSSPTAAARRLRGSLVIAEVALATVALIGAGLFARSFQAARNIDPGMETDHVLFGRFFIESTGYSANQVQQLMLRLRRSLEEQPGIRTVSYSDFTPLSGTAGPYSLTGPEGYVPATNESMNVNRSMIAPGYFAALRIPLLSGRDFTLADEAATAPVTIVNQSFARRYFHGADPIGRKVKTFGKSLTVVGLVKDSKYFSPAESPRPFFYMPFRQFYSGSHEVYLFVRTTGDAAQAIPVLRRVVASVDPSAAAFHAVPYTEYTAVALFSQTVAATLMGALGTLCLLLAALGIYSVMAYGVSQRTQEIGIRVAMGARQVDVIAMVVRQAMMLALTGLAIGIAAALAVGPAVRGMLVQVDATDPVTFGGAALFLFLVSFLAAWLPARRATQINPMAALRQE
jgi:predicted permease